MHVYPLAVAVYVLNSKGLFSQLCAWPAEKGVSLAQQVMALTLLYKGVVMMILAMIIMVEK